MSLRTYDERRRLESLSPEELRAHQLRRFNEQLAAVLPTNRFYADKLADFEFPLKSLDELARLPFTFKDELLTKQNHGTAANLTYPRERYVRFHQTSGTRGRPLVVLDTADDWLRWMDIWQHVFDAADIAERDGIFFAFSFGPYIGFWSALEAAAERGCMVIPAGGMSTQVRLELLREQRCERRLLHPQLCSPHGGNRGRAQTRPAGHRHSHVCPCRRTGRICAFREGHDRTCLGSPRGRPCGSVGGRAVGLRRRFGRRTLHSRKRFHRRVSQRGNRHACS
ncbi:MAG: hypothetical protein QM775_17960 [Pirellulales bacterium]